MLGLLLVSCLPMPGQAQYFDQQAVEGVLESERVDLDALPDVSYESYVFSHPSGNTVLARHALYRVLGSNDSKVGQQRAKLVELLNRVLLSEVRIGDTLVLPRGAASFDLDFRAYSPFPRRYPGAKAFDKLFVIDKSVQAFAAYEHGDLVRWGAVNTGAPGHTTPAGRYNFNWKEEYRVSSLSPKDEPWEMYWVFNFHETRGIHVHQYAFPAGGPTSHGCVRLIDADAKWIYNWADAWEREGGETGADGGGRLIEPGTTVLVLGEDPGGRPKLFVLGDDAPSLKKVELPADPYDVPPGTPQQERFDRLRTRESR